MIRVIVRNGKLEPMEPLPKYWAEGAELSIEMAPLSDTDDRPVAAEDLQQLFDEMEAHATQVSSDDITELNANLDENDLQQKELVRQQWNLTP